METFQRDLIRKLLKEAHYGCPSQKPRRHKRKHKNPKNKADMVINNQVKVPDGNSTLHIAVDRKDEDKIKELVQSGADLNAHNKKRETPLYRAAKINNNDACIRIIKYLIDQGADVYGRDYINKTFLHILIREEPPLIPSQFHDLASYLVGKGHVKLFNTPSFLSVTPFQFAVYRVEVEEITLDLLQENGVNLNVADELGRSVLFWAVNGKRSPEFLSKLIQLGADWKHRNYNKRNLLHQAANWGNLEALEFFIGKGLDVNAVDIDGDTPLHYVMTKGKENAYDMALLLIESGASTQVRDRRGRTPVDLALENNEMVD